jgi:hypothetical protein
MPVVGLPIQTGSAMLVLWHMHGCWRTPLKELHPGHSAIVGSYGAPET